MSSTATLRTTTQPTSTQPTSTQPTSTQSTSTQATPTELFTAADLTDQPALPCWSADPDLWFAERPCDVEQAKALCAPCPLREACLSGALERREPWGVWGGQLVLAGVVVPRKRPRGRPRKNDLAA